MLHVFAVKLESEVERRYGNLFTEVRISVLFFCDKFSRLLTNLVGLSRGAENLKSNFVLFFWYFSSISRKSKDGMKIIATAFFGVTFGFLIGISFPSLSITKVVCRVSFYVTVLCLIRWFFFLFPLVYNRNIFVLIFQVSLPTNFLPSTDLSYIEEKGSTIATPDSHKAWSSSKSNDSISSGPVDKSKACFFRSFIF